MVEAEQESEERYQSLSNENHSGKVHAALPHLDPPKVLVLHTVTTDKKF